MSSHRHDSAQTINIQSQLRILPDLLKTASLAVLFGSNGNSCIVCTQPDKYIYIYIYIYIYLHNIQKQFV